MAAETTGRVSGGRVPVLTTCRSCAAWILATSASSFAKAVRASRRRVLTAAACVLGHLPPSHASWASRYFEQPHRIAANDCLAVRSAEAERFEGAGDAIDVHDPKQGAVITLRQRFDGMLPTVAVNDGRIGLSGGELLAVRRVTGSV
jgi:hypothetical protein